MAKRQTAYQKASKRIQTEGRKHCFEEIGIDVAEVVTRREGNE